MSEAFAHRTLVGWGDLDANGHRCNAANLDQGATARTEEVVQLPDLTAS